MVYLHCKFPGLVISWETHLWVCLFWCFQKGLTIKDRSYALSACSFYHPLGRSSRMEIKENRSPPTPAFISIYFKTIDCVTSCLIPPPSHQRQTAFA